MFEFRGSGEFATVDDLRMRAEQIIKTAQEKPVYLLHGSELVGAIVGIEMIELLQDVLEDRYTSGVAEERRQAIRDGSDSLLGEENFWAEADAILARRRKLGVRRKGGRGGPA